MIIARVVPIRRLPTERAWFDYEVPKDLQLQPGHLVEISFGRQTLFGIVWNIVDEQATTPIKPIGRLVQIDPVMTEWQRQALEKISALYFVSLATLAASALPKYLKRKKDEPSTQQKATSLRPPPPRNERVWWYRDRQRSIEESLAWLLKDNDIRCICVPTIEDGNDFFTALGTDRDSVLLIHGQMNDREYRLAYEQIRQGRIRKVIGTGRIFQLPFPSEPRWLLDQEEHPAHRQIEQHPRLDNRQTVLCLRPQAIFTTPAPSIATMELRRPSYQSFQGQRFLASLGQPGSRDWLTPDADELIMSTISRGISVLAIVPHHGFAQRLACRDCGWTFECQHCHQRIRLKQYQGTTAECQACGEVSNVPLQCPRCQSTRWAMSGLGVEKFLRTLQQRWPQIPILPSTKYPTERPAVIVGTYQDYRLRRQHRAIGPVLLVSGDALLSYPDFAVSERAWSYLGRLQAERPDQPVIIQTYEPENVFWQRWRHGDERSWYENELLQRQKLQLPPYAEHWMIYNPFGSADDFMKKKSQLDEVLPQGTTVTIVQPTNTRRWQRPARRLLIQAPTGVALRKNIPWTTLLPTPWQIDSVLRGWSE